MRVLTILSTLDMGGIEKTLLSCLPYLRENGVEMSILCSLGGVLDDEYISHGVKLIDFGNHKRPFKDANFLKILLKNEQFDLVHSRAGHTSGNYARVCADMNVPFIVSIHNERTMFRNGWIGKPVLGAIRKNYLDYHKKLTLKYATKIVGHSKANLRYFTNEVDGLSFESQFQVLYNGVDFSKFQDYPTLSADTQQELDEFVANAEKTFVHVGSFKEQKNHRFLINIFKSLNPLKNNYHLILLGGGALRDEIRDYVDELGLKKNVLFAGVQTNIAPYLYRSDLFIFPSLYEGFGNVLIEAQYVSLPIAASSIPPHYEAAEKGYHQFLYDPECVEDAVRKIRALLSYPYLDDQKNKAKEFAKAFSVKHMVENLMRIYKNLVDAK